MCFLFLVPVVKHFNYSWPDMTVPTMGVMRDIVNVARCELYGKNKVWMFRFLL
jgi:hypothetical protein